MKRATLRILAVAVAAARAPAHAQLAGSVSVTGISSNASGDNPFRLHEYRDLSSGAALGLDLRCGSEAYWCALFAENLGRDDAYGEARGGRYGLYKYQLFGNDTIHNLTFGAITPYEGVGTNLLTFTGPVRLDTATWNRFDYSIRHRSYGALFELQPAGVSPFYVRADASRKESTGVRPIGGAGTSPGGPVYELPVPVDYTTTNLSVEGGYVSRAAHFSVNAAWSRFEDANDFVFWRNPIVATGPDVESSTLAADNDLLKLGVNAMLRQLPMGSTLALRGTWSKLGNSVPLQATYLSVSGTTGHNRLANPTEAVFEGEVVNKSLSASLTSQLPRGLDSRIYWNWYDRDNRAHHLTYTPGGPGSGGGCEFGPAGASLPTCTPEHLRFEKSNAGLELSWRLAAGQRLSGALDWTETERERIDFDRNRDLKATLQLKSRLAEDIDLRARYEHLRRKSDFRLGGSTDIFARYTYRFDAAPLDRDVFKISVDASPTDLLEVGAELIVKRNRYRDTVLGRTKDGRSEFYVTATYGLVEALRLTTFFDIEWTRYDSMHWVGSTATFPDPNAAGTTYLWEGKVRDKNYVVGAAAEYPLGARVRLVGSLIWQKTDGTVDFATPNNYGNPVDIDAYDSFRKRSLNVKALFAASKQLDVTMGFAHENYRYEDVQMDGYLHAVRTGSTQNLLTGAYAFPDYNANIVYLTLTYRFR